MSGRVIDLRSDTVTRPTPAMRRAMAEAEVGDDVYGEDASVNRLQGRVAELTGFEAGLFVPSGTMSNQIALAVHMPRGHEVICPDGAHIYEYEPGSMALISSALPRLVSAPGGVPRAEDVEAAIHGRGHQAPTGLISLENTHNAAGGTVVGLQATAAIQAVARRHGLPIHLDGARAFNAAVALGVDIAAVCAGFDSVSICLSKGLGAPVGSVLLGSEAFVAEAHRYRKLLGGGMRQAGVLAAAGSVALETMPALLGDDHARARRLAEGLAGLPGVQLDLASVQTNIVSLEVADAAALAANCAAAGIAFNALGARKVRLVTHHQVDDADIDRALTVIGAALRAAGTAQGATTVDDGPRETTAA
ncbi:MAG TPA: GntG family PLP-dependent aldolase [Trueperaceae bacterium]|nr:GntG family PLP-dependent aldolase [Trueperaceae bacterium]